MKILFLTHRLPYAPNRGDRVRAFHVLHELARWADVDLISLVHGREEASHAGELSAVARSVTIARVPRVVNAVSAAIALPSAKPTTHSLLRSPEMAAATARAAARQKPDVVLASGTGVAPYAMSLRAMAVPFVLDMVDVDSAKWAALSGTSRPPMSWIYRREARRLRAFEIESTAAASATLVVTPKEQAALAAVAPDAKCYVVPNGVDTDALGRPVDRPKPTGPPVVVFCGVMNYAPNVEGIQWFLQSVWPVVNRARPDIRLQIVGSDPAWSLRRMAETSRNVEVTGRVPDVRPYLWDATVAIAPLLTARGVQNKVLEAVAAGLPTVVTPVVFEGLPTVLKGVCVSAQDAGAFADAVLGRLADASAPDVDLTALSWRHRLRELRPILEAAAGLV